MRPMRAGGHPPDEVASSPINQRRPRRLLRTVGILAATLAAASCGAAASGPAPRAAARPQPRPASPQPRPASPQPRPASPQPRPASPQPRPVSPQPRSGRPPPPRLVVWHGPVEHLFFHTLVIVPRLAFAHDRPGQGFRDYFVTVGEFRAILAQLYRHRWTLVDIHRAVAGRVRVPLGRRPLVLSEDDVNYYDYSRNRGLGWRLVLDPHGAVKVEEPVAHGVRVTGNDLVPIVDAFVARHPDFSAGGARGVLAVTGYEGILGERVADPRAPRIAVRRGRVRALARRLKATGWTFANHSYGHGDLTRLTAEEVRRDSLHWIAEAVPLIGPTDVFIYPFGAAPGAGSPQAQALRALGFTIQCGIDVLPGLVRADGVTFMSRRHIDGIAFADQPMALRRFFDVATVEDRAARR